MSLENRLEQTDTHFANKPNYKRWTHWAVALFVRFMFACVNIFRGKEDKLDFKNGYWTQLGKHIYIPEDVEVNLQDPLFYSTTCHELAHRYDARKYPVKYPLTYVFSGSWRAYWEMRGYGIQLVAIYRLTGKIPRKFIDSAVEQITGPAYLYAGDEKEIRDFMERLAEKLESGELKPSFYDPSHSPFEDLLPE